MARILVVVADPSERRGLDAHLQSGGHSVVQAATAREGLSIAGALGPELALFDWALPDASGSEVCRELGGAAETRAIPVVVVSHSTEEVDRIIAFELGASDYVARPYSLRELSLRIAAILRRSRPEPADGTVIDMGRLRIDRAAHRVWVDGREVELTLLERSLLIALCDGRTRVQTRAALLEEVWGMGANVTTRTVDTHVKRLRDKLGPLGDCVETVRGIGYRLADLGSTERGATRAQRG